MLHSGCSLFPNHSEIRTCALLARKQSQAHVPCPFSGANGKQGLTHGVHILLAKLGPDARKKQVSKRNIPAQLNHTIREAYTGSGIQAISEEHAFRQDVIAQRDMPH
ncbi:unnamed protein product [Effrenium voratum]|nr:unnamed protein product [Effrenium voratum]